MKTVIDLVRKPDTKIKFPLPVISSVEQLITEVEQRSGYSDDFYFTPSKELLDRTILNDLEDKMGFKITALDNMFCDSGHRQRAVYIAWRGYTRWVYFKEGNPIYFSSSG